MCLVRPATLSLGQVPPLVRSVRIFPRPSHLRRCMPAGARAREPLQLVCIAMHVSTCAFHHSFRSATTAPPMPPRRPRPPPSSTCRSSVSRTATIPSSTTPRDVDETRRRAIGSETRAKAPTSEPSSSPSSSPSTAMGTSLPVGWKWCRWMVPCLVQWMCILTRIKRMQPKCRLLVTLLREDECMDDGMDPLVHLASLRWLGRSETTSQRMPSCTSAIVCESNTWTHST